MCVTRIQAQGGTDSAEVKLCHTRWPLSANLALSIIVGKGARFLRAHRAVLSLGELIATAC